MENSIKNVKLDKEKYKKANQSDIQKQQVSNKLKTVFKTYATASCDLIKKDKEDNN